MQDIFEGYRWPKELITVARTTANAFAESGVINKIMLNRSSVIVRPRQPYLDWASQLDDSGIIPELDDECTIYLIPEYGDDVQAMETLSKCFDIIFETELDGWCTDETLWPKNRSFKTFRNWFSFEFHSLVEDLCGYEIIDDESV